MRSNFFRLLALTLLFIASNAWAASNENVLHTFNGGTDGSYPVAGSGRRLRR